MRSGLEWGWNWDGNVAGAGMRLRLEKGWVGMALE